MKREVVAKGLEHTVLKAKNRPDLVLKTPRAFNYISLFLCGQDATAIKAEVEHAISLAEESDIATPPTRVFTAGKRDYIIAQRFVEEDGSVPDIRQRLLEIPSKFFLNKYDLNPTNFRSNNGSVYLVDLSYGSYRLYSKFGISWEVYIEALAEFRRFIRFWPK